MNIFNIFVTVVVEVFTLLVVVPAGCGRRAFRRRSSVCGRAESGEHLGPCAEADRGPVHCKLQHLPLWERDILATEQCGSFWEGGFQTALGDVSGEAVQFLKPIFCLPFVSSTAVFIHSALKKKKFGRSHCEVFVDFILWENCKCFIFFVSKWNSKNPVAHIDGVNHYNTVHTITFSYT